MAKARAIVRRRKAVQNIRKITQTMQLIATARFQKCLQRATATKPYTQHISEMVQAVVRTDSVQALLASLAEGETDGSAGESLSEAGAAAKRRILRVLAPNPAAKATAMVVITSNRGLCGAYNAAVLRTAQERRKQLTADGMTPAIDMVGKKGIGYFRFLGVDVASKTTDVEDRIAFSRVAEMADRYIDGYVSGRLARVEVVYMQFHSVGVQRPTVAQLLPIEPPGAESAAVAAAGRATSVAAGAPHGHAAGGRAAEAGVGFEFSPPPEELLTRLIPETVRIRLFQFFNDAIVSEQVSRMVAMKAATDAAGDMIKFFSRQYNRARQSQITMELADIVGGAEAVK